MVEKKDNNGNYDDKEEAAVQTITHHVTAIYSFTTSITWIENNGVDTNNILVLRRKQEKALLQIKK